MLRTFEGTKSTWMGSSTAHTHTHTHTRTLGTVPVAATPNGSQYAGACNVIGAVLTIEVKEFLIWLEGECIDGKAEGGR